MSKPIRVTEEKSKDIVQRWRNVVAGLVPTGWRLEGDAGERRSP